MAIIKPPYATYRVPGARASQAVHLFLVLGRAEPPVALSNSA